MTSQSDERARVRGYLLSQGERYTYLELWPRLVKARLEVLDALEGVSDGQARFKPDRDEWSIRQVALHVLNGSKRVAHLVELLARGGPVSSESAGGSIAANIDPAPEETDMRVEELRDGLLRDALAWSTLTQGLPEPPSFDATAEHNFFGDLHSRAWYLFQRVHDLDHARQIAAIKESPGYPLE
jgi:uncharacterized damage-inducible protein DinB